MSSSTAPVIFMRDERLKAEAAIEPDAVATGPVTKETQIIAIYGKGGIGKSFTLANLSYMMAQQGKKVLLIGCDPKSDTTSLLFGGKACPTIIETSSKKKLAGESVAIGDVCFKRDGVFAMELGGPEVGRGCGGRGIIHGFETLEKLLSRLGLRLRAARLSGRRGVRRLRPANCPRHVPEGHRRRQQRLAIAVRR
jgi:3,8-divinyl chlorophyllide a/chlorophyllide a reductase subunit X